MEPMTTAAIITALGSALGGMFGPDSPNAQKNEPYKGAVSGPNTLAQLQGILEGLGPVFTERLRRGVQLPGAFAQQPPVFAGGGMPMPIGVTGRDPALSDPSMLGLPGFLTGGPSAGAGGGSNSNLFTSGRDTYGDSATRVHRVPGPDAIDTGRRAIPRRSLPPDDPRANPDDSSEALAALKLMGLA